jgi:hypothetical protein
MQDRRFREDVSVPARNVQHVVIASEAKQSRRRRSGAFIKIAASPDSSQ